MKKFDLFLEDEFVEYFQIKESHVSEIQLRDLLNEYKEIILQNIINQFGLGSLIDVYKEGGNVTTLHNAKNNVFANDNDKDRFTYQYDRSEQRTRNMYDKPLPKLRKETFKNKEVIIDDYTGKELPKDGRAHIDHVVSAHEIQSNDEARLFMSDEERGKMATSDSNLKWTEARINQSKGKKDLTEWHNSSSNKNEPGEDNAKRFDIDKEKADQINKAAREEINKEIKQKKKEYYVKNVTETSLSQGHALGKRQAIGLFLYEFQKAFWIEMKAYFKNFKTYTSINQKIEEFSSACKRISKSIISKVNEMGIKYLQGFAGGVIGNILTVFINTFATTAKNIVRIINEGIQGLVRAVTLLVKRPNDMTGKEAMKEASKIIAAAVTTAIGVGLTEAFIISLKTTPLAMFADIVGGILGGILTGIVTATVVYTIDNIGSILRELTNVMNTIVYNFEVSAKELRAKYESVISKIETEYSKILNAIYAEYEQLYIMSKSAYDMSIAPSIQFEHTIKLAKHLNVDAEKQLNNLQDIKNFFK